MKIQGRYGTAFIYATLIDDVTKAQVLELMNQRFTEGLSVRIMPDCHAGKGCVIGTTMTIKDCCVPNLVGVDIGCGMLTVNLGKIDIDLPSLDKFITNNIPSGTSVFKEKQNIKTNIEEMRCYDKLIDKDRFFCSVGTLGGGNHFIEIDVDDNGYKYLVIHTGSRNLGNQVCSIYMKKAKTLLLERRDKALKLVFEKFENKKEMLETELNKVRNAYADVNKDLLPIYGDDFNNYLYDMNICQEYAWENRESIAVRILNYLGLNFDELEHFHTIHNYINMQDMILRKGAISAYKGEKVLIPINMRDGAIIAKGKSNKAYNFSAPHGAGRISSRNNAKKKFDLEDFKKTMEGVYSSSISNSTLDESPFAYKSIDDIIPNIVDTVEVIGIIKPIYNFKDK